MKRTYILPAFLFFQIIAYQALSFFPEQIEHIYSTNLYQSIALFLRMLLGKIPFSFGDCLYVLTIIAILYWFWKKRITWKTNRKDNWMQILSFASVFYLLFHLLWALNYSREPLFEKMQIARDYTDEDLLVFTQKLITKTNAIHNQIEENKLMKIVMPYTPQQVFEMNLNGYQNLSKQYPFFGYSNLSVKKSIFSQPLSYMGFSGYLNPFTNEAQVNTMGPMYNFPTTTCHEMAHQMGYASESECNFIGFLASIKNENPYFQYSGYSFALRYCLHNWEIRNPKQLQLLLNTVHPGILQNYKESEKFWQQYDTFIETGFKIFYDNFLKFNQQQDGLESYSKFVNLMVNYYRDKSL